MILRSFFFQPMESVTMSGCKFSRDWRSVPLVWEIIPNFSAHGIPLYNAAPLFILFYFIYLFIYYF